MLRTLQTFLMIVFLASSSLLYPTSHLAAQNSINQVPPLPPQPVKVFIPEISYTPTYTLTGQVLDSSQRPVSGVTVVDQNGARAVTDQQGVYQLKALPKGSYDIAASKPGMVFSPSMITVDVNGDTNAASINAIAACTEAIVNGGFEANQTWELPATAHSAAYTTAAAHSGTQSVRTGYVNGAAGVYSYSSVRQLINIPATNTRATLRLWLYPVSGEASNQPLPAIPVDTVVDEAPLASDVQYVMVLNSHKELIETLYSARSNNQQWQSYEFDLSQYIGRSIYIHIGSYNDGVGGSTGMYVDDVSLELCDDPAPAEPPSPIPGCTSMFTNSDFSGTGGWVVPATHYVARYSAAQFLSPSQSMRTGITRTDINVYSYSDAYQTAKIPSGATAIQLNMWIFPSSSGTALDAPVPDPPAVGTRFGDAPLANDTQYVLVLDANENIVETLLWGRSNSQVWENVVFDLTKYKGRNIRIQFGTFNNGSGGITSMYVDDAFLLNCTSTPPTPTPGPTPPPTPTPAPGSCTEKIRNTTFEEVANWKIPVTAFSANYSMKQAHTGVQSMRNGIPNATHNRFSYSDAYELATIPSNPTSATLTMWIFPVTTESTSLAVPERPTASLLPDAALGSDVQYVLILDEFGNWIDTLWWDRQNTQVWGQHVFDMSDFEGMTIRLQFGVYNDGLNGITSMYVDDVTLQVCP